MKRLAIVGSRGIPANYGGFETFAEEIGIRLAEQGFDVYVSCEQCNRKLWTYKGVKLFYFPIKPFFRIIYETIYDIYSLIRSSMICDYIYVLGYGAGFFFFIPKIFRKKLIVNVDGIEWSRDRYNKLEKIILRISEIFAVRYSDIIIADAYNIKTYIEECHKKRAIFIPYGIDDINDQPWDLIKLLEIENNDFQKLKITNYYLIVARLIPENNIHIMIEGFLSTNTDKKLLIIGNFVDSKYRLRIKKIINDLNGNDKIIFSGGIYKKDILNMLRQNCFAYFHGHSAGGTNPSLLEAMVMRNIIIAHDNKFNREVCDGSVLYFNDKRELKDHIESIDINYEKFFNLKKEAYDRVKEIYSWKNIVKKYSLLFKEK